jgi:hypothetical protein
MEGAVTGSFSHENKHKHEDHSEAGKQKISRGQWILSQ